MIESIGKDIPKLAKGCMIHSTACVSGNVTLEEGCSVWPTAVLRAEMTGIRVGKRTNIQDGAIIHINEHQDTVIGDDCTLAHRVVVHGCTIGNRVVVGMGAVVLDGAVIGDDCIIAAGSVVSPGKVIPPASMVMGIPGVVKRALRDEEIAGNLRNAQEYIHFAQVYCNTHPEAIV